MKITEVAKETEKILSINIMDDRQIITVLIICALLIAAAIITGS